MSPHGQCNIHLIFTLPTSNCEPEFSARERARFQGSSMKKYCSVVGRNCGRGSWPVHNVSPSWKFFTNISTLEALRTMRLCVTLSLCFPHFSQQGTLLLDISYKVLKTVSHSASWDILMRRNINVSTKTLYIHFPGDALFC